VRKISAIGVAISAMAAFVFLTIDVGTSPCSVAPNGGSPSCALVGTLVLAPGSSEDNVRSVLSALRLAGFGWVCFGVLCLNWAVRRPKESARLRRRAQSRDFGDLPPPPRYPFIALVGSFVFVGALLSGMFLGLYYGPQSSEFDDYFPHAVRAFMVAVTLVWLAK
jgi:hypothetical protein